MDVERVLLDLLVVLVAARLAAEVSERIGQPAVLGEIVIGIAIGPSALGLVESSDALRLLGEIGVILLLFEVGRQMDLRELSAVGVASLRVAAIGVVVPMAVGYVGLRGIGLDASPALYLAAAITATSVGITARVFGDLRALSTSEARIVLGAAVADDVIGLLVLTVVLRSVAGSGIDVVSLGGVIGAAIGFVVVATIVGAVLAPRLLEHVESRARTEGTVMAIGLAIALAFARVAETVKLAPIVGAFVAGLSVGRSEVADELHRKLTPLGHFFIPIFFLQIGIETKVGAFRDPWVFGVAALLGAIGVAGKLVAGIGASRGTTNRLLVGVGMIPRGEVGLIFASLGLSRGVLDARTYAVLLLVVLATTLVTPPWLRVLITRARSALARREADAVEPAGGWLRVDDETVELAGQPPASLALLLGLQAAVACAHRRPGPRLLEWLAATQEDNVANGEIRDGFFHLLREGNERSWRFLEVTGLLSRAFPEVEALVRRRPRDPFELEPAGSLRWNVLEDLKELIAHDDQAATIRKQIENPDVVLVAALARSALAGRRDARQAAERLAASLLLGPDEVDAVGFLVAERHLLQAAAARMATASEEAILDLASHLGSKERALSLYLLALGEGGMEPWERERLDELRKLIVDAIADPDVTGRPARDLVEDRREAIARLFPRLSGEDLANRLRAAPRRYLLALSPETIGRHLRMIEVRPRRGEVRLEAEPDENLPRWIVHVATIDARGVLASIAGAFASHGVSVHNALIFTWTNGIAIDVFRVEAERTIDWDAVRRSIEYMLAHPVDESPGTVEGKIELDNHASPWHTIVQVQAPDRAGLLHRVAASLSRAGLQIHQATVTTYGAVAVDSFWVTGRNGGKLDDADERDLRDAFAGKQPRRWHLLRRAGDAVRTRS